MLSLFNDALVLPIPPTGTIYDAATLLYLQKCNDGDRLALLYGKSADKRQGMKTHMNGETHTVCASVCSCLLLCSSFLCASTMLPVAYGTSFLEGCNASIILFHYKKSTIMLA